MSYLICHLLRVDYLVTRQFHDVVSTTENMKLRARCSSGFTERKKNKIFIEMWCYSFHDSVPIQEQRLAEHRLLKYRMAQKFIKRYHFLISRWTFRYVIECSKATGFNKNFLGPASALAASKPTFRTLYYHRFKTVNIGMSLRELHASFLVQSLKFHSGNISENSGSNKYIFK